MLFPKPYRKINAPHHPGRAHCLFALFAGLLFQHMSDGFKVDRLGDIAAHARIVALFAVGGKGVGRHGKDGHIVVGTVTGADTAGGLRSRTPLSLRDISPHCGELPPQRGARHALHRFSIQRPILQCFGNMRGVHLLAAVQVGDGAGHPQNAVVGAGAVSQALKRRA